MTKPINIYSLSRIHDEEDFNIVACHQLGNTSNQRVQYHEIESLRLLTDHLIENGSSLDELDGFFYSFQIPQIGKEFDLLKITDSVCLNIELKSTAVSEEQICKQLVKNRHYLSHLQKQLVLYSIVTDTMTCYELSEDGELTLVDFNEIMTSVHGMSKDYLENIDDLFRASDYLVSPLNTPERFINGEFFLTQAQEEIKKSVLNRISNVKQGTFFQITGTPGTGKTLLLYDLAMLLSLIDKTLIIHCGKLCPGQNAINKEVKELRIVSAGRLKGEGICLNEYAFILVDESHRIHVKQFESIVDSVLENAQVCIFSSDSTQILSKKEKRRDIVNRIKMLPLDGEYTLSEKIRTNRELHAFITQITNLNRVPKGQIDYSNVEFNYANTTTEAQNLLKYYRNKGYVFINFSKSNYDYSPYADYEEDFDTHHVIGQEFDKVVMLLDNSFYYDENGILQGVQHPNPDYLYSKLFYQGITRVRERLALIVIDAPELFKKMISIVDTSI